VESIRYPAPHLRERIDKILDLSKIEAGKQEVNETENNIPDLFISCISMRVELAKQAGISVKSANQYNLPHLLADESMIRQVHMNLLPNVIKFTPNGGNISLKAMLDENDRLLFEVTDTCIGIAKNGYDKALSVFG
jgi:signal transduction histidine kinase